MVVFVKLFLAHILGDFILQPSKWVEDKEQKRGKSFYLYTHTFLHFLLTIILVAKTDFIVYGLILAIFHGGIDYAKLTFQKTKTKRNWFLVDQVLHVISIVIIGSIYLNLKFDYSFLNTNFWVIVTAILLITKPTSIIIKNIISIWTPENKDKKDNSLQNAGNFIGILERLFVFYFVLTNHIEAIGFLLAAKSIFRFGDLKEAKDRKLTEYVLIGTLLSFGIAFLLAIVVNYLTIL
ncbi:MAG TPA: DUF3307 domain-containing protein [Flavobacterium sp.]|jgi:hypothetical protein|uniref:DUF3307 domain-containing protein n=1 Tax=Flavobacterium sp. TaxID=239 RepID=UPI002C3D05BE|nr:DUF3307 domain-containing protein [Flavobacterium sp.]HPW97696.1 DUF3307 domain-containing protein [Flavobacterium sp.]HQA74573.1 DUF3307 domain-containing protein [Flavobacterium sp.]